MRSPGQYAQELFWKCARLYEWTDPYINTHSTAPFPIFTAALQPLLKQALELQQAQTKKHPCKTHVVHLASVSISIYLTARSTIFQYLLLHVSGTLEKQKKVNSVFLLQKATHYTEPKLQHRQNVYFRIHFPSVS